MVVLLPVELVVVSDLGASDFDVSEDDGVVVVVEDDDGGMVVVVVDDVDGEELAGGVTTTVSDFGAGGVLTTAGGFVTTVGRSQATRPAAASKLAKSREYFMLGLSMWKRKHDSVTHGRRGRLESRCDHTRFFRQYCRPQTTIFRSRRITNVAKRSTR